MRLVTALKSPSGSGDKLSTVVEAPDSFAAPAFPNRHDGAS